jgi:hypothetical protein
MPARLTRRIAGALMPATIALAEQVPRDRFCGFLIDLRGSRNTGTYESNYMFASEDLAAHRVVREARVAMLLDAGDTSHDFVRSSVRNLGFNGRAFFDEDEAVAWLESRDSEADDNSHRD